MKYAMLKSPYHVVIKNKDIPEPDKNQVCIKTAYCGVCGTDKIMAKSWCKNWAVFGHEISGTIHKTGSNVTGFTAGQKAVVKPGSFCGECPACKKGFWRKCSNLVVAEGGFSEYITVDKRSVVVADDSMSLKSLSLVEPLNVAIDIIKTADITSSDNVVLFGPGLIGIAALYLAKHNGASIKGIIGRTKHDYLKTHLANLGCPFINYTKTSGIDKLLRRKSQWVSQLEHLTATLASRVVVIHTAPPQLINSYIRYLPFETCIVNIGLSSDKRQLNLNKINMRDIMFKRTQLMSSFSVPSLFFDEAIGYIRSGVIDPDMFIDKTIHLDELCKYLKPNCGSSKFMKITVRMNTGTP